MIIYGKLKMIKIFIFNGVIFFSYNIFERLIYLKNNIG